MGQNDTDRISHDVVEQPNVFRDRRLNQIINDLSEEDTGKGFSQVLYVGSTPFVDKIVTWDSPSLTKKRNEVQFTYSPSPFISQIVKTIFDEETGSIVKATITATLTLNPNKTVASVDVVTARF